MTAPALLEQASKLAMIATDVAMLAGESVTIVDERLAEQLRETDLELQEVRYQLTLIRSGLDVRAESGRRPGRR